MSFRLVMALLALLGAASLQAQAPAGKPGQAPSSPAPAGTQAPNEGSPATATAPAETAQTSAKPGDATAGQAKSATCAACHGMDGHARTPVADRFRGAGAVAPVDFTSARVRARTDGQLHWIVIYGLGNMPPFRHLLTGDDVWLAVRVIRGFQG